jgi:hypothetical protein
MSPSSRSSLSSAVQFLLNLGERLLSFFVALRIDVYHVLKVSLQTEEAQEMLDACEHQGRRKHRGD